MLTAAELAALRATQNQALPGSAVIERYTLQSDGMGGYEQAWAAVGTIAARLYPQNAQHGGEHGGRRGGDQRRAGL